MKRDLMAQVSEQMGISKKEAGGLMAKAKKANDSEGFQTGGLPPGMGGFEPKRYFGTGYLQRNDGGIAKKTKVY
jgi:hypothetical protein